MSTEVMDRRAFMRRSAAGTVATLGVGAGVGTGVAAAQEDDDEDDGGLLRSITGVPATAGAGAIMITSRIAEGFSGMFAEDMIDRDEAIDVEAENLHQEVYLAADSIDRFTSNLIDEFENMAVPDDPVQGAIYNMAFSSAKAAVFESLQDGESVTAARVAGLNAIEEYIATRQNNYIDSFGLALEQFYYYQEIYRDRSDDYQDWLDEMDDYDDDDEDEPEQPDDPLADAIVGNSHNFNASDSSLITNSDRGYEQFEIKEREYTLADGTTIDSYEIEMTPVVRRYNSNTNESNMSRDSGTWSFFDGVSGIDPSGNTVRRTDDHYVTISAPEDFSGSIRFPYYTKYSGVLGALTDIESLVKDDFQDYTDEIYDLYDSGDVEDLDILNATDLVTQFGESDGLTRSAAEMVAMGYNGPEELSDRAVITSESDDLEEVEGILFLRWADSDDEGTTTDTIPIGREVTEDEYQHALFSYDDGESSDFISLTESWIVERVLDAEGNRVGETDIENEDEYDLVIEDGLVRLFVEPTEDTAYVIETTNEDEFFILGDEFEADDEDDPEEWTFDASDTLEEIDTEIERIATSEGLGVTQYNDQSSDASRSIEEMEQLAAGRETVADLDTGGGAGALFGGVAAALGVGVGTAGAIVVGAVLLYVSILTR